VREVTEDIDRWRAEGARIAVARVVRVEGSGPRAPGATMVVTEDGRVAGSVSGGCVEGAVVEEALALIESGEHRLVRFGYSDDEAFAVGLTCGGVITILITSGVPDIYPSFKAALAKGVPFALATVVANRRAEQGGSRSIVGEPHRGDAAALAPDPGSLAGGFAPDCVVVGANEAITTTVGATMLITLDGNFEGSLGDEALDRVVARDGSGAVASGQSFVRDYAPDGRTDDQQVAVFIESFAPAPRMIIFGAVDFTAALARVAKVLGYHVTVCDARPPFATAARFPQADEVVVDWPHRYLEGIGPTLGPRDAICVLTHDPKFDVPAIVGALATEVGYIGAMGSRRTHAERSRRLIEAGVSAEALQKVMAPIGLDLGARTPEETAVAICAEIISRQTGHRPASLRDGSGPIHSPEPEPSLT
jgi:xanthine dehydrogenase accessory factor